MMTLKVLGVENRGFSLGTNRGLVLDLAVVNALNYLPSS